MALNSSYWMHLQSVANSSEGILHLADNLKSRSSWLNYWSSIWIWRIHLWEKDPKAWWSAGQTSQDVDITTVWDWTFFQRNKKPLENYLISHDTIIMVWIWGWIYRIIIKKIGWRTQSALSTSLRSLLVHWRDRCWGSMINNWWR